MEKFHHTLDFTASWADLLLIFKRRKQISERRHDSSPKGIVYIIIMFSETLYEKSNKGSFPEPHSDPTEIFITGLI